MLQLAVVFAGAYAAFALAQYQAMENVRERRSVLQAALAADLHVIAAMGQEGAAEFEELQRYASALDGGGCPALRPLDTNIPFSPDVWDAALVSGGVELLDPTVVVELSEFYGSLRLLLQQIERADDYTRTILLPNIDRPQAEFYGESCQLQPKYSWYRQHVSRLATQPSLLGREAAELRQRLIELG